MVSYLQFNNIFCKYIFPFQSEVGVILGAENPEILPSDRLSDDIRKATTTAAKKAIFEKAKTKFPKKFPIRRCRLFIKSVLCGNTSRSQVTGSPVPCAHSIVLFARTQNKPSKQIVTPCWRKKQTNLCRFFSEPI